MKLIPVGTDRIVKLMAYAFPYIALYLFYKNPRSGSSVVVVERRRLPT